MGNSLETSQNRNFLICAFGTAICSRNFRRLLISALLLLPSSSKIFGVLLFRALHNIGSLSETLALRECVVASLQPQVSGVFLVRFGGEFVEKLEESPLLFL
jgi:hypothetical protein